jgi:hypothetical protein
MGRTKAAVAIVAVLILAGGIVASNMGFRIVRPLKAADGGVESLSGVNSLGLPYVPKPGLATVADLWDDLVVAQGVDVLEIRRYDPITGQEVVYTDGESDFPLQPGEGYLVQVGSDHDYTILGSHNPGAVLILHGPGPDSVNGTQVITMPYHALARNASDLFKEIGSPPIVNIQRYDSPTDQYAVYAAGLADFPLVPGEAYRVKVSSRVDYVPAH